MIALLISLSIPWALIWSALASAAFTLATSPLVFGSVNQSKIGWEGNNRWFPCPSAVTSGMPVLIGSIAAVAMDAYDASTGGTTFYLDGSCFLTVSANSVRSPISGVQINAGDELYATGTLDVPTNVTYNLTIDKTLGNVPFGNLEAPSPIPAGTTYVGASVRLKLGGSPSDYVHNA